MRKFTKLMFALALTVVAVGGAKAEQVYTIDYSTFTGFPFYVMGYVPEWVGGVMTDYGADYKYQKKSEADAGGVDVSEAVIVETNDGTKYYRWTTGGGWHQYNIASDIPVVVGGSYKVKALVKASAAVDIDIEMRWAWDGAYPATTTRVTIPQSDEFVEVEWEHTNVGATSAGLTAKPGSSTVTIEWKSLTVYTGDPQYRPVYSDLRPVTPNIYAKNAGEGGGTSATPDGEGIYSVESATNAGANDWDTQFWIATPEQGLPVGQKFHVVFSYKAEHAANVQTQTHIEEYGGYKTWHCVGETDNQNIAFTTAWKTIDKEVTIESDMAGWKSIAFNLNIDKTANKYYFKDIVLKVPEFLDEYVDVLVGASGWVTYSSAYDVDLGATSGYAAQISGTSVVLSPVTQVPANNAVLIEGAAGNYSFDVIASATAISDNDLQVSDGNVTSDDSNTVYTLANLTKGVGFYKVKAGVKVPKGKAYLEIAAASAPDFLAFEFGDPTSISELNVKSQAEGEYYNLAGQRVAQPTKGLYIVNGKKVVIK